MSKKDGPRIAYTVVLETPKAPSYLYIDGLSIAGSTEAARVSVADVPDAELRKLGKKWTENLLERAAEMRKARPAKPGRPA